MCKKAVIFGFNDKLNKNLVFELLKRLRNDYVSVLLNGDFVLLEDRIIVDDGTTEIVIFENAFNAILSIKDYYNAEYKDIETYIVSDYDYSENDVDSLDLKFTHNKTHCDCCSCYDYSFDKDSQEYDEDELEDIVDEIYDDYCEENEDYKIPTSTIISVYRAKDDGVIYITPSKSVSVEKDKLYISRTIGNTKTITIDSERIPLVDALEQYFDKVDEIVVE